MVATQTAYGGNDALFSGPLAEVLSQQDLVIAQSIDPVQWPSMLWDSELSTVESCTQRNFYTQELLHTEAFTQAEKSVHRGAFTQRSLYTEEILHTEAFTQSAFTQMSFHTQKLLHTEAFKQRSLYTQTLLHTEAFTHRNFYEE